MSAAATQPLRPRPGAPTGPEDATGPIPAVTTPDLARHRLVEDTGGPGTTRYDDAAVATIAAQVIGELDDVGGAANRILGVAVGADNADRHPKVGARVDGATVTLTARLSIIYPAPIGHTTDTVRARLIERLGALTGLTVRQVEITVAALHNPTTTARRLR